MASTADTGSQEDTKQSYGIQREMITSLTSIPFAFLSSIPESAHTKDPSADSIQATHWGKIRETFG
jgi:hypothetical protein